MRLTNSRCGWTVEGKLICYIASGVCPTDDEMLAYWHLKPGDARYADHARISIYTRVVLLKHNGNFVITPLGVDILEISQ